MKKHKSTWQLSASLLSNTVPLPQLLPPTAIKHKAKWKLLAVGNGDVLRLEKIQTQLEPADLRSSVGSVKEKGTCSRSPLGFL